MFAFAPPVQVLQVPIARESPPDPPNSRPKATGGAPGLVGHDGRHNPAPAEAKQTTLQETKEAQGGGEEVRRSGRAGEEVLGRGAAGAGEAVRRRIADTREAREAREARERKGDRWELPSFIHG